MLRGGVTEPIAGDGERWTMTGRSPKQGAAYSSGIQQRLRTRSHVVDPHLPLDQAREPSTR